MLLMGVCGHCVGRTARQEGFVKCCARQCRQALEPEKHRLLDGPGQGNIKNKDLNLSFPVTITESHLCCVGLHIKIVIRT